MRMSLVKYRAILTGQVPIQMNDTVWDDATFPLVGRNIDTTSGRIDYNFFNGGIDFADSAEFRVQEAVSMLWQMKHCRKLDTIARPHLHWLQVGSDEPNWLLAYKKISNGESVSKEIDFSNHLLLKKEMNAFTYTSGSICQLTSFGDIDTTGMGLSDMIHFVLFRDSDNDSGLFAGADPSSVTELAFEFDVHFQIDQLGSSEEFTKY